MNRPLLRNMSFRLLAWVAVAALSAVVALAQKNAAARTDSQIEMDVVHALDAAPQLKNDLITAATIQGEVTLSGTVAKADERQLAESLTAKVEGVAKVHNNLKVGDPQADSTAQNLQMPAEDTSLDEQQQQATQQQTVQQDTATQQTGPYGGGQYADQNQYGQYPQQTQPYRPAYPAQPGYGYAQQQPQQPAYRQAPGPLTIPAGTLLALRTSEPVESKHAKEGQPVQFVLISDINSAGYIAIPRGATFHGVLTEVKNTQRGDLGGSDQLAIRLTSLDLGGQSYELASDEFLVKGPSKAGRTAGSAIGGALLGAIIGGAAGGGAGAAIGAGAGAGVGTAASAASRGPSAWIPAEARVDFHLKAPVTVTPVSEQEALRLSQGLYQGGPALYQRQPVYYGAPYPPPPPVYYRPYYSVGGAYVWR